MSCLRPVENLFRNVRLETLDPERDAQMIILTVLTYGSWGQIKWLFMAYGWDRISAVVRADILGLRVLPESVRVFWANAFFPEEMPLESPDSAERWRAKRRVPDLFAPNER